MTDFLYPVIKQKRRAFPARSLKSSTTKIFQKVGNALMNDDTTKLLLNIADDHLSKKLTNHQVNEALLISIYKHAHISYWR